MISDSLRRLSLRASTLIPAAIVLAPALLAPPAARADALDVFKIVLGTTLQRDDNLFRLSDGTDPNSVLGKPVKSDVITTNSVALRIDKPFGLQRFELDAGISDYRYRTFDHLNFTARNYAAAWRWSLTPRLRGNLSRQRSETLNSFVDFRGFNTRNVRRDNNTRFDAIADLDGVWQVLGGVSEYERRNGQRFEEEGDNRHRWVEGGVRYRFRSGTNITYRAKSGSGEFFNRPEPNAGALLDNRFEENEHELRLVWPIGGRSSLDGRAAYVERKHEHFPERDFSGGVGHLNFDWGISGKTRLLAGWTQELSSYQDLNSSYVKVRRVTLGPSWSISHKTSLRLRYDHAWRDYEGAVAPTGLAQRSETLRSALVAFDWQPLRSVFVAASFQHDRRLGNQPGLDFTSNTVGVSGRLSF